MCDSCAKSPHADVTSPAQEMNERDPWLIRCRELSSNRTTFSYHYPNNNDHHVLLHTWRYTTNPWICTTSIPFILHLWIPLKTPEIRLSRNENENERGENRWLVALFANVDLRASENWKSTACLCALRLMMSHSYTFLDSELIRPAFPELEIRRLKLFKILSLVR